jgi:hypothetical protein
MRRRPGLELAAALLCGALALALAGCGSDASGGAFPQGKWTYNDPGAGRGERTVEFRSDGTFAVYDAFDAEQLAGTYTADGETLALRDPLCGDVEGTYAWSLRGDRLALRAQTDDCTDRRTSLDSTSLTPVE